MPSIVIVAHHSLIFFRSTHSSPPLRFTATHSSQPRHRLSRRVKRQVVCPRRGLRSLPVHSQRRCAYILHDASHSIVLVTYYSLIFFRSTHSSPSPLSAATHSSRRRLRLRFQLHRRATCQQRSLPSAQQSFRRLALALLVVAPLSSVPPATRLLGYVRKTQAARTLFYAAASKATAATALDRPDARAAPSRHQRHRRALQVHPRVWSRP